jgi:hypothetical protein
MWLKLAKTEFFDFFEIFSFFTVFTEKRENSHKKFENLSLLANFDQFKPPFIIICTIAMVHIIALATSQHCNQGSTFL